MDRDSDTETQRELSLEFRARQQTASSGEQGLVTATKSDLLRDEERENTGVFFMFL